MMYVSLCNIVNKPFTKRSLTQVRVKLKQGDWREAVRCVYSVERQIVIKARQTFT